MYKTRITIAIAIILLMGFFFCYIFFGSGNLASELRNGISESLDEDFKIKESIGKIFFAEKETDSVSASSNISVASFIIPAEGEKEFCDEAGGQNLKIYAKKYSNVVACADGVVENVENDKITLRICDGKLVSYRGVGALVKQGKTVKQNDTIGYAKSEIELSVYENCISLDASGYFF